MKITRNKLILFGIVIFIFIIGIIQFSISNNKKSPSYSIKTVNKDTGQTIITYPNKPTENTNGYVTILGTDKLINSGLTSSQLILFNKLITDYINKQLSSKYNQVAVLNDGYSSDGNNITSKIRLGNSNILLDLKIKYPDLYKIQIMLSSNDNNNYYDYDSGVQTTTPPSNVNNPNARFQ